jgi:hypothetical protein
MAAEMGIRTEQFADGPHLASWTAMCPGNHESAGKRKSGQTRKVNRWLRGAPTQAAWAASPTPKAPIFPVYFGASRRAVVPNALSSP